jgi:hypothetical protein
MKPIAIHAAVLLFLGCGHASTEPVVAGPAPVSPQAQPQPYVSPTPTPTASGARVAVSSVNLGDYCPEIEAPQAQSERSSPAGASSRLADADYTGTSDCQIVLTVDGTASSRFRIVSATLIGENGQRLQSLGTGAPQIWRGDAYQPWNEQLGADGSANVLYSLSNIDWSRVPDSYRRPLRVELVVEVDGAATTLTSPETIREAMIVT